MTITFPDHRPSSIRRVAWLSTALALTLAALSGCADPAAEPTEKPAFASEADAFAAAEDLFATHVAALNKIDLADTGTFEAVYAVLSGRARSTTAKELSELHAANVRSSGLTGFNSFEPIEYDESARRGSFAVCLDVSDVSLVDASGASLVSPDRADLQAMRVTFTLETATDLSISSISTNDLEDFRCE